MEKLGVITEQDGSQSGSKSAEATKRCPVCNAELSLDTNVPTCSTHGTKPFEPADGNNDQ